MRLLKFWYIDSFFLFFRTWQHVISFLEEDLAVGLMLKLLFVPLFHDSSVVGKALSFLFRSVRIFMGLFSYGTASLLLVLIAITWIIAPALLFAPFSIISLTGRVILFLGVTLFLDQALFYPREKLWNIRFSKDIWKATRLKRSQLNWSHFSKSLEVQNLLKSLELGPHEFVGLNTQTNEKLLAQVFELAKAAQAKYVSESFFFVSFLKQTPGIEKELLKYNLKLSDFEQALVFEQQKRNQWRKIFIWDEDFAITHLKGTNRGWLGSPTPILDSICTDLTKRASILGSEHFLGRQAVVDAVVGSLSQSVDRNVVLVGPAGAGKSTLVNHLAARIVAGNAPEALATKRLLEIDLAKLLSGAKTEGDVAEKIEAIFEEARFAQNLIVYFDEIQNFALGDAGGAFNIYSLLLPHLESNDLLFLASTEPESYTRIIEKTSSFSRVFKRVDLPPSTPEETLQILQDRAINLQRKNQIMFSFIALKDIVKYSFELMHDRVSPDSALSVFNEAARLNKNGFVGSLEIKEVVTKRVHVPLAEVDSGAKQKLLNLEKEIHFSIIGQEEAVKAVANTLRRSATGIRDFKRPIGSFLFVGPTGVGKTELAKVLCEVYFSQKPQGPNNNFFRFDMSEYQTQESINRLIGDRDDPGLLTEAVRHNPYSLLLLDEFEKADPKLLTVLLQVLDDGRLTDGAGRLIDFTNTIIIATSNAGSLTVAKGLQNGETIDRLKQAVQDELLKAFKPELVNRFDDIVIFRPLSAQDLQKVVQNKLKNLQAQMQEKGYLLEFTPELVAELGKRGFDPVFGARPLRRLIQDTLEANLSKMILEGKVSKGEKVLLDSTNLT